MSWSSLSSAGCRLTLSPESSIKAEFVALGFDVYECVNLSPPIALVSPRCCMLSLISPSYQKICYHRYIDQAKPLTERSMSRVVNHRRGEPSVSPRWQLLRAGRRASLLVPGHASRSVCGSRYSVCGRGIRTIRDRLLLPASHLHPQICRYLDSGTVLAISRTCKSWRAVLLSSSSKSL